MKKTTQKTTVKTRRKYADVLKQQALQLLRLGQSFPTVSEALGIGDRVL